MSLLIRASTKPAIAPNRSVKKTKTVKKTTSSVKAPPLKPIERPNDFLSMAERINGRAAMIGFTSAVIDEVMTGNSISTQFHDNVGLSVAVAALAFLGTAANPKDEGYVQGFWKPETELLNGRLAMVGVISLLLTESLHPHVPLF
tara:strand:+ start:1759 stop:2193 length:435 start_codon:yes stop_codon:yes gene_type:complete